MIWCVEDDASVRDIEIYTLRATGYEARGFSEGKTIFSALRIERPDLIVLKDSLPGEDCPAILRRLRTEPSTAAIPVILTMAPEGAPGAFGAVDVEADDRLVRPFGMMEMVARVEAVLRRAETQPDSRLRFGGLVLDPAEHTVTADGAPVALTSKEFELLRQFLSRPGAVFSRERLLDRVWGEDHAGTSRTVDVHIRTLRVKLGPYGQYIDTIRGVGYRWKTES